MRYCTQEQIVAALADKLGIPYIRVGKLEISTQVLALIPADIAMHYNVLPLVEHNNRLIVAMEDPLDWKALDLLRFHTNKAIEPVITSRDEVSLILDKYYIDHGENDLLRLIVEIKGYRREDAKAKKETMDTYWIPGVNSLGTHGRWAFAEFTDAYQIDSAFNQMIECAIAGQK